MEKRLYSPQQADALTRMEHLHWRQKEDQLKADYVIANLEGCMSLLEIGCGWGQMLETLRGRVGHLAGLDESAERLTELSSRFPDIEVYRSRAAQMSIPDESFDVVLASQMLHEVKLFGKPGELQATLKEIKRILKKGGRYFLIDHFNPGKGNVVVSMGAQMLKLMREFRDKFQYRKIYFKELSSDSVIISKMDIQDFATKTWAMGTSMEQMEMQETHTPFTRNELKRLIESTGMQWIKWENFHSISEDFNRQGIRLKKGKAWNRKLFMIARRP